MAEILPEGSKRLGPGFGPTWVRIVPTWISSWGIEGGSRESPYGRRINADIRNQAHQENRNGNYRVTN